MITEKLSCVFNEADGVLLTSSHNLRYFTGFSGGEGFALITREKKYLFVDSRYTVAAKEEAADFEVVEFRGGKRNEEVAQRLCGVKRLAYEDKYMSAAEYHGLKEAWHNVEWYAASEQIEMLRMVKTKDECALMRRAEQIGTEAFEAVLPLIKTGTAEIEIAAELEYQMRKRGAEGTSFETIVVSGVKSSMPHGKPDAKKIETGDFITMDFGCRYGGYCSDMTRTIVVGEANAEQKKIYATVLKAQLVGLETICAGIAGKQADAAARKVIEDAGFGKFFGHSLGHGVGLLIHELPNLSPFSETILCPGMVVTCEPGIYIPDFGGVRIEDMICVEDNGIDNMTKLSKELLEI